MSSTIVTENIRLGWYDTYGGPFLPKTWSDLMKSIIMTWKFKMKIKYSIIYQTPPYMLELELFDPNSMIQKVNLEDNYNYKILSLMQQTHHFDLQKYSIIIHSHYKTLHGSQYNT